MATKITDKAYLEMQEEIKVLLIKALKIKAITGEELMAVLFILGQASTAFELETIIEIFSDVFPVLSEFASDRKEVAKGDLEERVKVAVSKLMETDPIKATEIAKAALEPDITWEEIKKTYPEIEE